MTYDVAAIAAQAAAQAPNMNDATKGGGDYTPPPAGRARARLVAYIELGIQHVEASKTDPVKYPAKDEEQVDLVFELSGKGYEPKDVDGKKVPIRITVKGLKKSLNEKAHFYKIFKAMNYDRSATHFAQLLGKEFLVDVVHSKPNKDGKVFASLKGEAGYTIRAPFVEVAKLDDEGQPTGEFNTVRVTAGPLITDLKLFLWDMPSKAMWASLFIDGEYEERKDEKTGKVLSPARSKNVIQERIMSAKNWIGSPMQVLLDGGEPDIPEAEAPARTEKPATKQPAATTSSANPLDF